MIFELANLRPNEKVLDIGCGTGIYALEFAKLGMDTTCYDLSKPMLDIARRKAEKENVEMAFVLGSAEKLPFEDESFDMVTAVTTIEFVEEPKLAIEEMKRVVKRNGRIVLGILNKLSVWAIQRRIKSLFDGSIFKRAIFFDIFELAHLLKNMKIEWNSTLFALLGTPSFLLKYLYKCEGSVMRVFKPFGAFIAVKAIRG